MKWMDKLDTGASSGPFKKILGGHLLKWLHLLTRKKKKKEAAGISVIALQSVDITVGEQ